MHDIFSLFGGKTFDCPEIFFKVKPLFVGKNEQAGAVSSLPQTDRGGIGQEKPLITMGAHQSFPELCRKTGSSLGVYGCLEYAPEHGGLAIDIFHNIPLFSTVMELIPTVTNYVNTKRGFCE
jgi:hypothetical protein